MSRRPKDTASAALGNVSGRVRCAALVYMQRTNTGAPLAGTEVGAAPDTAHAWPAGCASTRKSSGAPAATWGVKV